MKKLLISITIFIFLLSPLIVWGAGSDYGLKETADKAGLDQTGPKELPTLIGKVLGTGLSLVGVLFFALMLYGGLTWMLARGNSEQESSALSTITAAIIGIIIVLASYAITNFVFKSVGPGGGTSSGGAVLSCQVDGSKLNEYCNKFDISACQNVVDFASDLCMVDSDTCVGDVDSAQNFVQEFNETECNSASGVISGAVKWE